MSGSGDTSSRSTATGRAAARPGLRFMVAGVVVACLMPAAASGHAADRFDLRGQTGTLSIKTTANTGAVLKATATFSPHRRGRPVVFQVKAGSHWRKVAIRHESATGAVVFSVPTTTPGKFTYRAVALAFNGLAAVVTSTRSVTIIDTGKTTRVNLTPTGGQSTGSQHDDPIPSISADGRYIAFESWATDLVATATPGRQEVYVRDQKTGTTTLVSAASDGTAGDDNSGQPAMSADGRYVAYTSLAINIVPEPAFPSRGGEFLWDRETGQTIRVDEASDGTLPNNTTTQWTAINADGRYVAYWSNATNLTPAGQPGLFLFDRVSHTTTQIAAAVGLGADNRPALSADGRYVAFATPTSTVVPGDTNNNEDVFLWDRITGTTRRVSVSATHQQGNGASDYVSISANGRYLAYESLATNLVPHTQTFSDRVLMWDRKTNKTSLVSPAGPGSTAITPDGSAVAFHQADSVDIGVWDRATRRVTRVSVSPTGAKANFVSVWPAISASGRYVTFMSFASNLVRGDTNIHADVFLRDRFPH